jgi:GTP:adenosylcobinamide-phosphate guanylyltransferase
LILHAALVLAGERPGGDPLALQLGVANKALIEVGGESLLIRVLGALQAAGFERIAVSTGTPQVADLAERFGATVLPAQAGPSQSVSAALEVLGAPLLVTTADHALLAPEWVARFLSDAPVDADICVLLARREVVEAAAPTTRRTYFKFADGAWSGCNLFYLATPEAAGAIALWRQIEADRKRPWRIVRRMGLDAVVKYALGRLTLSEALARLGRLSGVRVAVVACPFGLAAVDVDKPADLDLVRNLV